MLISHIKELPSVSCQFCFALKQVTLSVLQIQKIFFALQRLNMYVLLRANFGSSKTLSDTLYTFLKVWMVFCSSTRRPVPFLHTWRIDTWQFQDSFTFQTKIQNLW